MHRFSNQLIERPSASWVGAAAISIRPSIRVGKCPNIGATIRVDVFPDDFYADFFDDYDTSSLSDKAATAIATARRTTAGSGYQLYEERVTF